ncbi:MAG TPA: glutamine amidotransferase [Bryobacteraceae bacterium]|nr:glutamine amidotransferase [Bryobacteraceae bacterium]
MFEFLFKYPGAVFQKGQFVLLAPWPLWMLAMGVIVAGALLLWHVRRHSGLLTGARSLVIWTLETGMIALLLFLLWHPAISIATLRPQQNVVAVMVDDSRSMGIREGSQTRGAEAAGLLDHKLLGALGEKFQVRLYRFGKDAERIQKTGQLTDGQPASRIGDSLEQVLADSSTLPLGAVVLLSDGADNSGGVDLDTISQIRRRHIPVHTIGFGREKPGKDIEITDAVLPSRALPDSRLSALVTFRQYGFAGEKAQVSVRDGSRILATRQVQLKGDGAPQSEALLFSAGSAGPKTLEIAVDPLPGEENRDNNSLRRLVNVESRKPRILYMEGEPRWEFKFIRRAAEDDRSLQLASMLRTTQNKIYYQGFADAHPPDEGFPAKPEELFAYDGLIVGSVEANYFTETQQDLIREFANRRGGGILFLGGRFALADGGYQHSPLAELLPVELPANKGTFHRDFSSQELTAQGKASLICRLLEDPERNAERWTKMPQLANYNDVGEAKPGAVVLMEVAPAGRHRMPLLVTENYGRGRTAVFATSGSWRWRMWQDHTDTTHATFWQQLMRHLVSDSPGRVSASTARTVLADETRVTLRAEVRDKAYKPVPNAVVEAHIVGPDGKPAAIELTPVPLQEGAYSAEWNAEKPGTYVAEIVAGRDKDELGRDVALFRREDGVAENFHTSQNRELLEKLASETGGRYYRASDAGRLAGEISYSEAGITTRETKDLWDMPAVFLLALLLRGSEWVLRRRWGVV